MTERKKPGFDFRRKVQQEVDENMNHLEREVCEQIDELESESRSQFESFNQQFWSAEQRARIRAQARYSPPPTVRFRCIACGTFSRCPRCFVVACPRSIHEPIDAVHKPCILADGYEPVKE